MNWLTFVTTRPVAVSMLTLAVLLFGWVSSTRLNVTLLPELSYPTATVRTEYAGAAPAEIESLISKPIEEALSLVRQVRRVESVSRAGISDVTLEFDWGTAMDFAVLDIREKLDPLELPRQAQRPVVLRVDPASDPIMRYGLSLAQGTAPTQVALKRLRRRAEDTLQKPLESLPGVAAVKVSGGLEEEIQIRLDLHRLNAQGISSDAVIKRLAEENVNLSGGRVDEGSLRYLVRTRNQFHTLEDMRMLILRNDANRITRLEQVADVEHGHRERDSIIRINGAEAVEIAIYREGDGNTVATAKAVADRLQRLEKSLPSDMQLVPLYDQSRFITDAISGVLQAGLFGGLLAVLVLYLFLGQIWSTLIITLAIPVSVIASFVFMYASGLSLNIMSLGGLALAIGLLIDAAIVVLESIARHRERGDPAVLAARLGTAQVMTAIVASTLTTIAVFFPMVFVDGVAGQLFADQALMVSATLLIALLVAVTLIPMLASRERKRQAPAAAAAPRETGPPLLRGLSRARFVLLERLPGPVLRLLTRLLALPFWLLHALLDPLARHFRVAFGRVQAGYPHALEYALRHRSLVLAVALTLGLISLAMLRQLGAELLPPLNQGAFRAMIELDPGTPIEETDAMITRLQNALKAESGIQAVYGVSGSGNRLDTDPESSGEHTAELTLVLDPAALDREKPLMQRLREQLAQLPGLQYRLTRPTLFSLQTPLQIELAGYDLAALQDATRMLEAQIWRMPRFTDVESSLGVGQPEIQIRFDQERVAAMGLEVAQLAERVVQAVQGQVATRYRLLDREIDVLVRAQPEQRDDLESLTELVLNPGDEATVTLGAVAEIRRAHGPGEIRRIDHQRVAVISANLAFGELSRAIEHIESVLSTLELPPGIGLSITGQSEEMAASFDSLRFALGLAVFLVYLVMASQFESLIHPFVILTTLPLAAIGAIFALFLTGTLINVVVLIGLIVLAGIVVNNGIVLIDRINQLRETATGLHRAIVDAATERLRPILMTSLTTILGLLPLALSTGQGAELRTPLAITVIGGLSMATLLTLFLVPVVYSLLDLSKADDDAPD